jgi:hypothetical protein
VANQDSVGKDITAMHGKIQYANKNIALVRGRKLLAPYNPHNTSQRYSQALRLSTPKAGRAPVGKIGRMHRVPRPPIPGARTSARSLRDPLGNMGRLGT